MCLVGDKNITVVTNLAGLQIKVENNIIVNMLFIIYKWCIVGDAREQGSPFPALKFTPTLCSFPLMGDKTWPGGQIKFCRIRQTMDNSQHIKV